MATHNGMPWLVDQLDSILAQIDVDVELHVSDDVSSDGTFEFLEKTSKHDPRILLLSSQKIGSAGRNAGKQSSYPLLFTIFNVVGFNVGLVIGFKNN